MRKQEEKGIRCITDAAFVDARESFSEYCGLIKTIPLDAMLWCESNYEREE